MFSISCFERSTCLNSIEFGTVIKFVIVYSYDPMFFMLVVV
jgi:hypothetical protein